MLRRIAVGRTMNYVFKRNSVFFTKIDLSYTDCTATTLVYNIFENIFEFVLNFTQKTVSHF